MPSSRPVEPRALFRVLLALLSAACLGSPHPGFAQSAPALSTIMALNGSRTGEAPVLGDDGALYGTTTTTSSTTGGLVFRATVDGYTPQGGLLLGTGTDRRLYGTTRLGDVNQASTAGTIFALDQDGSGFTTLHRFQSYSTVNLRGNPINADGAFPDSQLIQGSDGFLYGVTRSGGANGTGTVFRLLPDGSGFDSLHAFAPITSELTSSVTVNADGIAPVGALVEGADGYLYGVTREGGANGNGTLYRLTFDGSVFQTLHVFAATTVDATTLLRMNAEGALPSAGLVDGGDGHFYGVASSGGGTGHGTIFSIVPDGPVFTVLHVFDSDDGSQPLGALLLGNNRLYGSTAGGGTDSSGASTTAGTIFSIALGGTGFTTHYSFDGTQGANPVGRLLQLNGDVFVGVTSNGGQCGYGTVYRFSLAGDTVPGNTSCGARRDNDGGGGSTAPLLLLLLGAAGCVRRKTPV